VVKVYKIAKFGNTDPNGTTERRVFATGNSSFTICSLRRWVLLVGIIESVYEFSASKLYFHSPPWFEFAFIAF